VGGDVSFSGAAVKEKAMKLSKVAIATAAFGCATMFSLGWSEQGGVSLSIESAQARIGRPLTPMSVAGVARRQNRRAAYGYGYGGGLVGAGVGAAAGGTAAAVAATGPLGWGGAPSVGWGGGAFANPGYYDRRYAAQAAYYGGGYGDYNAGPSCIPGTLYLTGGLVQMCK